MAIPAGGFAAERLPSAPAAEPDEPPPLRFAITARRDGLGGDTTLAATYGSGAEAVHWIIVLRGSRKPAVDERGNLSPIPVTFSQIEFRHADGGDPSAFFRQLAVALQARSPKLSRAHERSLLCDVAILGENESLGGGGPGPWTMTKLFLAGDVEMYFNFDIKDGTAEFSFKDEDYGDGVIAELSKVIW